MAFAAGFLVVTFYWLAILVALGALVAGVGLLAWMSRAVVALALAGAFVLGYGFSNVGIHVEGLPIPLAHLLLVPMGAAALIRSRPPPAVWVPIAGFVSVAALRLLFDWSNWGPLALRDATLATEMSLVFVGYWIGTVDGPSPWARVVMWIAIVTVSQAALYPVREWMSNWGPEVGLQRPTPLLGHVISTAPAVATSTLFLLFRGPRWLRLPAFTLGVLIIGLLQVRSIYFLFPLALVVFAWQAGVDSRALIRSALGAVLVVGTLLGIGGSVSGRLGPVSLESLGEQVLELPGSGTVLLRASWARETLEVWSESPGSVLLGVGFGPDLAFGFLGPEGQLVRKPHNDFLEVLARTGIIGLGFFVAAISSLGFLVVIRAKAHARGLRKQLRAWVLATSVIYLGVAAVQPLLSFSYGTIPVFFLLGWAAAPWPESSQSEG
jgi:hypothetical protein